MAGLTLPVLRVPRARGHRALGIPLLVVALLAGAPPARAQAPRAFKIGILTSAWSPWHSNTEGFRDALKALGYIEGQTVTFEVRPGQGDPTIVTGAVGEPRIRADSREKG